MNTFERLQEIHSELIELTEDAKLPDSQLEARVEEFVKELRKAGSLVDNSRQRNQLRTLLRYWGSFIYDRTNEFPNTRLQPAKLRSDLRTHFWVKSEFSDWLEAGKIPVYCFEAAKKVTVSEIDRLVSELIKGNKRNSYAFIIFQGHLGGSVLNRLRELRQKNEIVIIPITVTEIGRVLRKPYTSELSPAYLKLAELKEQWSTLTDTSPVSEEIRKLPVVTGMLVR